MSRRKNHKENTLPHYEEVIECRPEWIDEEGFLSNVDYLEIRQQYRERFEERGLDTITLIGLAPINLRLLPPFNAFDGVMHLRFRIKLKFKGGTYAETTMWLTNGEVAHIDYRLLTVRDRNRRSIRQAVRVVDAHGNKRWHTTGEQRWVRHWMPEDFTPFYQTDWVREVQDILYRRYEQLGHKLVPLGDGEDDDRPYIPHSNWEGVATTPQQAEFLSWVRIHLSTMDEGALNRTAGIAASMLKNYQGEPAPIFGTDETDMEKIELDSDLNRAAHARFDNEARRAWLADQQQDLQ